MPPLRSDCNVMICRILSQNHENRDFLGFGWLEVAAGNRHLLGGASSKSETTQPRGLTMVIGGYVRQVSFPHNYAAQRLRDLGCKKSVPACLW